ncbi:MAG: hypothetical protein K2F58_05530 [Muribaculaceae bacterium]|nr:hypothetical protein [Muribaculaceae bacterium]MDE6166537.1 hypothetical protein [Muribaculaceae bacterium]
MNATLAKYGNIPMSAAALALEFPDIRKSGQKLSLLERNGTIIRLKRGLYVCPERITGTPLSLELIANRLLSPSYVSMSTALRHYGLIPEAVYLTQSMTTKDSREYETPVGWFSFTRMKRDVFNIGIRNIVENGYSFLIASPEKALCDLIAATPGLHLRYKKEAIAYLEEDIRYDMDAFHTLNAEIFEQYIALRGKKSTSIQTILNLLRVQ